MAPACAQGAKKPKQYQLIGGKPVIWWTLRAFLEHPAVQHVQAVIGEGHEAMFNEAVAGLDLPLPVIGDRPARIPAESASRLWGATSR